MGRFLKTFFDSSHLGTGLFEARVHVEVRDGVPSLYLKDGTAVEFFDLHADDIEKLFECLQATAWERHAVFSKEYSKWRKGVGA